MDIIIIISIINHIVYLILLKSIIMFHYLFLKLYFFLHFYFYKKINNSLIHFNIHLVYKNSLYRGISMRIIEYDIYITFL